MCEFGGQRGSIGKILWVKFHKTPRAETPAKMIPKELTGQRPGPCERDSQKTPTF